MKKSNFFWVSYADLMTSLFFIMLVLYVITFIFLEKNEDELRKMVEDLKKKEIALKENEDKLRESQEKLRIENERLNKLLKLEEIFKPLEIDESFIYLPACKKYLVKDLMGVEIFKPNQATVKPEYLTTTINIGHKIEAFLKDLNSKHKELSYLLVIEGNMANTYDKRIDKDYGWGYSKSYERALAVYEVWKKNGINFRDLSVEVMLCGSGFNGLCRDRIEENNKRFSVQIIPKLDRVKYN